MSRIADLTFLYNDPDNSSYFELGYSTTITDVGFDVFLGASPGGDNMYYGNDKFAFVNVGITASKKIKNVGFLKEIQEVEILFQKDDVVAVGETIAVIETEGEDSNTQPIVEKVEVPNEVVEVEKTIEKATEVVSTPITKTSDSGKFYSPLVRNIAQTEGVSMEFLLQNGILDAENIITIGN